MAKKRPGTGSAVENDRKNKESLRKHRAKIVEAHLESVAKQVDEGADPVELLGRDIVARMVQDEVPKSKDLSEDLQTSYLSLTGSLDVLEATEDISKTCHILRQECEAQKAKYYDLEHMITYLKRTLDGEKKEALKAFLAMVKGIEKRYESYYKGMNVRPVSDKEIEAVRKSFRI